MYYFIIENSQQIAAEFGLTLVLAVFLTKSRLRQKSKTKLIFLDPFFVARSSLVLSWALEQTWVLDFRLRLFA